MTHFLRASLFLLTLLALPTHAAKPDGIRSIDFKNFFYPWSNQIRFANRSTWHWLASRPRTTVHIENGIHRFRGPGESESERSPVISMDGVAYGDLDGDGSEEAAVHLNYSTGGTQNWDYMYVYKLVDGRAKLFGLLISGERGYGGLLRSSIENGLLVLDFADPDRRVGDCCSEGYIRLRYRLQKGAIVEQGPRERGDLNLNER